MELPGASATGPLTAAPAATGSSAAVRPKRQQLAAPRVDRKRTLTSEGALTYALNKARKLPFMPRLTKEQKDKMQANKRDPRVMYWAPDGPEPPQPQVRVVTLRSGEGPLMHQVSRVLSSGALVVDVRHSMVALLLGGKGLRVSHEELSESLSKLAEPYGLVADVRVRFVAMDGEVWQCYLMPAHGKK